MSLTHSSIVHLKNWKLSTNFNLDNENSKWKKTNKCKYNKKQKRGSRELIPYTADLTGVFIFSRVNNKMKSRLVRNLPKLAL